MIRKDCNDCIKRQTMYCPNSNECYCTFEKPYHLDNLKALNQLQQKENIIKEVREYIQDNAWFLYEMHFNYKKIFEILDKENK